MWSSKTNARGLANGPEPVNSVHWYVLAISIKFSTSVTKNAAFQAKKKSLYFLEYKK